MKTLSLETTKLLDKLYNLRGKDSVVLVEMDKQKEISENTLERTTKEKSDLQEKIANLQKEYEELESQGERLKEVLAGIDKGEFQSVLNSLNIDFDPEELLGKVNESLPKTIEKVSREQESAESELVSVEEEMNNAITNIEELGIRKDAALANQEKLNEYFDLALNGKINITRDSITSLLEQFNFNEEEQREAAKILMFPEDALYLYDDKVNISGKSISDVMTEAKDAYVEQEPVFEDVHKDEITEEEKIENDIFGTPTVEETTQVVEEPQEFTFDDNEKVSDDETFNPFIVQEEQPVEEKTDLNIDDFILNTVSNEVNLENKVEIEEFLNNLGLNYLDFTSESLDDLKANLNEDLFRTNVELITSNNIDLDIFSEHPTLLYDNELKGKIELLLSIGKEPIDIYLNPTILLKYTTEKLSNAIELLKSNGMDPKNVPLMAY